MKKGLLLLGALCAGLLLCGCTTQSVNPLAKNEATAVPGLAMNLPPAAAEDGNVQQVPVTLYFRYLSEPMLAPEARVLTVRRDESVELAIVRALVDGPSAGHSDLKRLLPVGATVESVTTKDDLLFVTFDGGLLSDDIPADWAEDDAWRAEAPLQRKLAAQSIAASLTESFPYTGVQILVHPKDAVQADLRLQNSYFLAGQAGLSDPLARDETLLLTPANTVAVLLAAWQQHDVERLYRYVAEDGKPVYASAAETLSQARALAQYAVSGGSVSQDGQSAVVAVTLSTLAGGTQTETSAYPLCLLRDNGVWKISWERLLALMAH